MGCEFNKHTPNRSTGIPFKTWTQFHSGTKTPPHLEYITAVETMCHRLNHQDADELRSEINRILKSSDPPKLNISKAECKTIQELKRAKTGPY